MVSAAGGAAGWGFFPESVGLMTPEQEARLSLRMQGVNPERAQEAGFVQSWFQQLRSSSVHVELKEVCAYFGIEIPENAPLLEQMQFMESLKGVVEQAMLTVANSPA